MLTLIIFNNKNFDNIIFIFFISNFIPFTKHACFISIISFFKIGIIESDIEINNGSSSVFILKILSGDNNIEIAFVIPIYIHFFRINNSDSAN